MTTLERTIAIGGDLRVRRLGFGTMSLTGRGTWGPPADRAAARAVLRRARELGVELFDTADSYGPESAEELLAEAFGPRYEGVTVATKAGLTRQGPGRWDRDCRPTHLRRACEGSLRRLGVERIDLFQLHTVDPDVPLEESLGTLVELQSEGKIREIGVCNVDAAQLRLALTCAPVASVQNRYSAVERGSDDVVALCEAHGLAFLAWAPLAKGALAGAGGAFERIAVHKGSTPGQVALAWLLYRSPCVLPIPGTSSVEHLVENVGSLSIDLDASDLASLGREPLYGYRARRIVRKVRVHTGKLARPIRRGRR